MNHTSYFPAVYMQTLKMSAVKVVRKDAHRYILYLPLRHYLHLFLPSQGEAHTLVLSKLLSVVCCRLPSCHKVGGYD